MSTAPDSTKPASFNLLHRWQRYKQLLQRRWWILFLTTSLAVALQGWNTVSTPPKFGCNAKLMLTGRITLPNTPVFSEETNFFIGTQIELMQSPIVRTAAASRVQTLHPELNPCAVSVSAVQQPRTAIFVLQAIGDEPKYTQALLDAVTQEYINARKEMRSAKSDTTLSAITNELKVLEKEIKSGDEALVKFQKENNLNFLKDQTNNAGSYVSTLDNEIAKLTTEYELLRRLGIDQNLDRINAKNDIGNAGPAGTLSGAVTGVGPQGAYLKAKEEIQLLKAQLAERSQDLKPKHPIIIRLQEMISLQEKLIEISREQSKSQLADRCEAIRIQIENLKTQRDAWAAKAVELSGRAAEYETLKSRLDRSKALFDHLLTSMQAVDVNKSIDQDAISILETASNPLPIKPGLAQAIASAVIAGIILGLAILFLVDQLDSRLLSMAEFEAHFTEHVLGRIPREAAGEPSLLQPDDDRHIFAEAFSNLRSSLLYLPYDNGLPKTIIVTSAVPNEGKSTVSSNLATVLAFSGARTLLIDADLRRGAQHEAFGTRNERGFAEVLIQGLPWREALQPTRIANLTLLPCGQRLLQPSKDFLGPTVDAFLKEVRDAYDFVIFDSCPVLAADDTTTLAPKLDATLFVVRLGFSERPNTRNAMAQLYDRQVNLLGCALNCVDQKVDGYHYYSYTEYYSGATKA